MDPLALKPGIIIGDRFELEGLAGSGGAGVVFRARDRVTGAPVALKLRLATATTEMAARWNQEGHVLAQFDHPRVVGPLAHGRTPEGWHFLAMPWLEGEDLRRLLARRRLSTTESLLLARWLAEGLAAAHQRGLVHRNLKPSNVFLRAGRQAEALVIDFSLTPSEGLGWSLAPMNPVHEAGRAAHVDPVEPAEQAGPVLGTLCYLAPERVRGEQHPGPGADVFALGCVLYECWTGQPAFAGQHLADALRQVLEEDPLLRLPAELQGSPLMKELLRKMLAKTPAARLADGSAVLTALQALVPDAAEVGEDKGEDKAAAEPKPVTFILAMPPDHLAETGGAQAAQIGDPTPGGPEAARWSEVEAIAEFYRARLHRLAPSSANFAVSLARTGLAAAEQARYMARLMLTLKERLPDWAMVATTVYGAEDAQAQAVGEALWHGKAILAASPALTTQTQGQEETGESRSLVWLDETTTRLLDTRFQVQKIKEGAYVLEAARSHLDHRRLLLGRPTPCVGREQELFFFEAVLAYVREDMAARAVLILASPGEGKTRLRHEFVRRLEADHQDVEILFGRSDPVRTGAPYRLLTRALLGLCGLFGHTETLAPHRDRFASRIVRHVPSPDRQRILEFLGEMCGLPFPDDGSPQLRAARQQPRLMSEQIEAAWLDFLRAECAVRPVLLALEDVHWADAPSMQLMNVTLRELANCPLMVLALARPDVKETFPDLWAGRHVQELRLPSLSKRACEQLVRETLGELATPETVDRIVRQAGGNALFLEELIRAVVEGNQAELPDTVLAVLAARFLRLAPDARRILRAASVWGEAFWRGGVAKLLEGRWDDMNRGEGKDKPGVDLDRGLEILIKEELIVPHGTSRFAGDPEFGFRHALLRDAALAMLSGEERRAGHRLAAEYLERRGEPDLVVVAEHYELGELREQAARWYGRAAMQALGQSDLAGGLRCFERGVACGASGETLGVLRSIEAWIRFWSLEIPAAYTSSSLALETLSQGSVAHYMALGITAAAAKMMGQMEALARVTPLLLAVEPAAEARHAFIESAMILAGILVVMGDRPGATALVERMEKVVSQLGDNEARTRGLTHTARACWLLYLEGDVSELCRVAQAGSTILAAVGDRRMQGFIEQLLGSALVQLGDYPAACTYLRQLLARLEHLQEPFAVAMVRTHLALALIERGDPAGLAEARQLAATIGEQAFSYWQGLAHAIMAQILTREGAWVTAEEEIRQALKCSVPEYALQPMMYATLTEILLGQGNVEAAVGAAREGLALLDRLGGKGWLDIKLHLAAAHAYLRAGHKEEAQGVLRRASQLVQSRAERIADETVRKNYLTAVPYNARVLELARQTT